MALRKITSMVLLKCEKNDGIVVHVPWRWQPKIELSISF
jgi:hypothetical protein